MILLRMVFISCLLGLIPLEVLSQTDYGVTEIYGMKVRHNETSDGSIEVIQYSNTDRYSSWASTELVIVKIKVDSRFELHDIRKDNTLDILLKQISYGVTNPLVVMSGGFFDTDNGNKHPIGLVIENFREISEYHLWDEGGILIQQPGEDFLIVPVDMYEVMEFQRINYALQSLPLVVEDGEIAIRSKSSKKGHRIGIGYDKSGNVIIACGFAPHPASFSLYDFAHLLTYPESKGGPDLDSFIALDGGPSIYLHIPSLNLRFGRKIQETGYIANLLSIFKR